MEKATTLEEKLDPFGAETGRMARNLDNKIVANDGRNMEIKNTVERMEEDFVPTLVRLFPGKKGEVIKYIRMAGYQAVSYTHLERLNRPVSFRLSTACMPAAWLLRRNRLP